MNFRVYSEEEIRANILNSKYHNLNEINDKMLSRRSMNRPTCEELLNDKILWALDAKELDSVQKSSSDKYLFLK